MDKVIELFKTPGFTAVLASLGAVVITSLFNAYIEKRREQQQFVRQILPERMNAHNAILKALVDTQEKLVYLSLEPPAARPKAVMEYAAIFHALCIRNTIWSNSGVMERCWKIHDLMVSMVNSGKKKEALKEYVTDQEYCDFLGMFAVHYGHIHRRIIEKSGIPLLDKILSKMDVKPKNILKKNFHQKGTSK